MIVGPFVALLAIIGVVVIIVWILQWASDYRRRRTTLHILNERFARGEIDRNEYEEKPRLIGAEPVRSSVSFSKRPGAFLRRTANFPIFLP
jgi:putative membrane protein